jgi:hypothetical protein
MKWFLSLGFFFVIATEVVAGPLTAGTGKTDISPANGTPMAGYYSVRGCEGIHDPLYAKAIVFEQDGVKAVLVSLDLIGTTPNLVREARQAIEERTRILGANVLIAATHSHTGPILSEATARIEAYGGGSELAKVYRRELPGRIAEAVKAADAARVPVTLFTATGSEDNLAFNRRFHMTDGNVGWNPGKLNPKIVRPAGPTDPSVPVVFVKSTGPKPATLAILVNFAMHLDTVGGLHVSADYPYWLSRCLSAAYGDDVLTLFTTGTCGDINHIDVRHDRPQKGNGEAARIGTRLAAAVLKAAEDLKPALSGPIRMSRETVELPLAPVTAEQSREAKAIVEKVRAETKPAPKFLDQVQAFKAVDVAERLGKPWAVEVQVITLGSDIAFVSLPGEIFVELGLAIKAASPFRTTIIAELANGSIGYIPTQHAYPQGNYEVISSRCAAGSGERLVDSATKQLRAAYAPR